jgi:hypothetical protein
LSRQEEGLDQLTLAAASHAGKASVPVAVRHLGFGVEPFGKQLELRRRKLPALDAIEEVLDSAGGRCCRRTFATSAQMP